MASLVFFSSPPISAEGLRRVQLAADNSPPFKFGESRSDGVKALQQALIALFDPQILIPDGPTGNYLHETQGAVHAFQKKFRLVVDGVAGRQTIGALDLELNRRSKRVLERLDRCIDSCKPSWAGDSYRLSILYQMEADLRNLKSTNVLGFAAAAVVLVLLVILFFAVMMFLALPQNQKAMQRAMSQAIEAVRGRGEVAQQKIEELKTKIREFLSSLTDIRSECEKNKEQTDPDKFNECKRIHALLVKAAFEALIRTLKVAGEAIITGLEGESLGPRGLKRLFGKEAYVELGRAFLNYLNALNDFFKCLGCPEIPLPFFPEFPDFL
jgi:competence protein ComGC